jgi:hypothetical protein
MNRLVLIVLLLAMAATMAQADSGAAIPAAPQTSQKVIKDPAEYNAYMAALNEPDAAKKAALMEAFVQTYPQSVVKNDALDWAMAGYQQAGNLGKAEVVATQIVAAQPDHYRALLIVAYAKRVRATQQQDPKQALALATEARTAAEHALQVLPNAPPPEGVSKEEFEKQRAQMEPIFHGVAGFGLLQAKDYAKARDHYLKADLADLQNTYQLSVSELEMNPIDLNGFWHVVKSAQLAEAQKNVEGMKSIAAYGKAKYKKYHGSADGWDAFAASVAAQNTPPPAAELAKLIPKAPTPCEIAVKAVKDNNPADLSFSDYEFVLQQRDCSAANQDAADRVWNTIQSKQKNGEVKMRLNGVKLIASNQRSMEAALSDDNQANNVVDLHIVMDKPVANPPAAGSMIDIIGVLTSYALNPFVFIMEKGELPVAKPAVKAPAARDPAAGAKKKKQP